MNIRIILITCILVILGWTSFASAATIEDFKIAQKEKTVNLQWKALGDDIVKNVEGYAIQWSKYQTDVQIDKTNTVQIWKTNKENYVDALKTQTLFEKNSTYYMRVYTWTKEGAQNRTRVLGNGSKIVKFAVDSTGYGISGIEYITANDPVISSTTTTTTDTTTTNDSSINAENPGLFGKIRVAAFDNHAFFSWSRTQISSSESDGRLLIISTKSDLSSPILDFSMDNKILSAKIENLTPSTTYYVEGYYYKNTGGEKKKFERSGVATFKTTALMTDTQKIRMEQLRKQGVLSTPTAEITGTVGQTTTTSSTSNTTTSSTNSTSSNTSSTSNTSKTYTRAEILKKISDLQKEINIWRALLNALNKTSK